MCGMKTNQRVWRPYIKTWSVSKPVTHFHAHMLFFPNINMVTLSVHYVMCIPCAEYHINANTNLLVPRSNASMTWPSALQGIGASHCDILKAHGHDWKPEVSGCESHVREVVERTKNSKRESEKKGDKVSCLRCCSFSLFKRCSMTLN